MVHKIPVVIQLGRVVARGVTGFVTGGPVGAGIGVATALTEVGIINVILLLSPI